MTNHRKFKVLILSTREWFGSARLPQALTRVGFEVASLSFAGALVTKSRHVVQHFVLPDAQDDEALLTVIRDTLAAYAPELVIPGDDPAVELLHALAARLLVSEPNSGVVACLRRSLGNPQHYAEVQSRRGLHRIALELGLRTPAQGVITDLAEAQAFAVQHGFPLVVKAENTCAGFGTRICKDEVELAACLAYFAGRFGGRGQGKPTLTVQRFIVGRTAMRAIVAAEGDVLGGLSAIKVETHPAPTGPSTVVDFFENQEMERAVVALCRAFALAGFASFDFIVEETSGAAYLIELNPRPVPICHLGGTFGDDLALLLWQRWVGSPATPLARDPRRRVALFPQEWIRRPQSAHIAAEFHDVPWEDPGLVHALVENATEQLGWGRMMHEEGRRQSIRKSYGGE